MEDSCSELEMDVHGQQYHPKKEIEVEEQLPDVSHVLKQSKATSNVTLVQAGPSSSMTSYE